MIQKASSCCYQRLTTRVWRQGCIFSIYPFSLHGESELIKHLIAQTGSRVWSGGEMLSNILVELVDLWETSSEQLVVECAEVAGRAITDTLRG